MALKVITPYIDMSEELAENTPTVLIDPATDEEESEDDYRTRRETVIDGRLYKPGMFKPGKSGNPAGRPKGKTLKEWSKEYIAAMTDDERMAFLAGLPKEVIWRMAEGNPSEDKNISISVPTPILGGMTQLNDRAHDKSLEDTHAARVVAGTELASVHEQDANTTPAPPSPIAEN